MPQESGTGLRRDIQVLRGIAVLQVVLYHAAPSLLAAGYLGVDVFLVISGYLVTRMVLDRLESGHFSFAEFYGRRARRLLPASSCTFLACALLAPLLLAPSDQGAFVSQLLGALTFSGNVVLWRQGGYWDAAAALKPLLHVWSLSLEEQYYLLLPALLILLGSRFRVVGTGIAFLASAVLCVVAVDAHPFATFYLLPARAWELLMGSLCAMYGRSRRPELPGALLVVALALILVVPAVHPDPVHPRLDALLVTASTAALLLGRLGALGRARWTGGLALVGDWSYSLYLVHWPLFALAANAYAGGTPPWPVRLLLVVVALALAGLQYRLVECRYRGARTPAWRLVVSTSAVGALAVLVTWGASVAAGTTDARPSWRRPAVGLREDCDVGGTSAKHPPCATSPAPEVALWGDSLAMHLVPGLLASGVGTTLLQMTRKACGPVLDVVIARTARAGYDRGWAEACLDFNRRVLDDLAARRSVRYVVMSTRFPDPEAGPRLYRRARGFTAVDEDVLLERYAATVKALRALGKKVVVVAPPPSLGRGRLNIGLCLERAATRRLLLGRTSCDFAEREYVAENAAEISLLRRLARAADVAILWPGDALCSAGTCRATIGGTFMYRDTGHLSHDGSVELQRLFALDTQILRHAR